jgi:hypothetical protein
MSFGFWIGTFMVSKCYLVWLVSVVCALWQVLTDFPPRKSLLSITTVIMPKNFAACHGVFTPWTPWTRKHQGCSLGGDGRSEANRILAIAGHRENHHPMGRARFPGVLLHDKQPCSPLHLDHLPFFTGATRCRNNWMHEVH